VQEGKVADPKKALPQKDLLQEAKEGLGKTNKRIKIQVQE
jgi:hypothetical protein